MAENPPRRPMPVVVWISFVAAVVLTVVVTWLVVGVLHAGRDEAKAGTTYAQSVLEDTPASLPAREVWVPNARFAVTVSTPRVSLPRQVAATTTAAQFPPDGGHFVAVQWLVDTPVDAASDIDTLLPGADVTTTFALVTGGHTYPLRTAVGARGYCVGGCTGNQRVWVAVPGSGTDVRVAVTYAGVTQTLDPRTGKVTGARVVSGAPVKSDVDCGAPTNTPAVAVKGGDCAVIAVRTPWRPGRGWAPAGQQWIGVDAFVGAPYQVVAANDRRTSVDKVGTSVRYAMAGAQLIVQSDVRAGEIAPSDGFTPSTRLVFRAPAGATPGPLTVSARFPLFASTRTALTTANAYVASTWTVRL